MVKIVAKAYNYLPCSLEVFTINGQNADYHDFGDSYDSEPDSAEPYGCGCHIFGGKMPTQKVLDEYNITLDEYAEIVDVLESVLYVGSCGLCI